MEKRGEIRLGIPRSVQFSLIWSIFFSIIGFILQSFSYSEFIFKQAVRAFFVENYLEWAYLFRELTHLDFQNLSFESIEGLFSSWYYFCISGGIIALLWGILYWIIHLEIFIKKPIQEVKPKPITEEEIFKARINELISLSYKSLREEGYSKAREYYSKIKEIYSPLNDPNREVYIAIQSLYQEIIRLFPLSK